MRGRVRRCDGRLREGAGGDDGRRSVALLRAARRGIARAAVCACRMRSATCPTSTWRCSRPRPVGRSTSCRPRRLPGRHGGARRRTLGAARSAHPTGSRRSRGWIPIGWWPRGAWSAPRGRTWRPVTEGLVGELLRTAPPARSERPAARRPPPQERAGARPGLSLVDLDQACAGTGRRRARRHAGAACGARARATRSTPTRPGQPQRRSSRRTHRRPSPPTCSGTPPRPCWSSGRRARSTGSTSHPSVPGARSSATAPAWAEHPDGGPAMKRPRLLFHCQHSVGLGHLVRSMHLADGLGRDFDVTLLNGGPWPADLPQPGSRSTIVHLPHVGSRRRLRAGQPGRAVHGRGGCPTPPAMILEAYRATAPDVVLIELLPFGRKKFTPELMPLLEAAHSDRHDPLRRLQPPRHPGQQPTRPAGPRRPREPGRERVLRRPARPRRRPLRDPGGDVPSHRPAARTPCTTRASSVAPRTRRPEPGAGAPGPRVGRRRTGRRAAVPGGRRGATRACSPTTACAP